MIKTGDEPDAGTDGNVFLQMFGDRGKTQTFSLREEGDKRRFERGRMDKFVIRTQDVGKVCQFIVHRKLEQCYAILKTMINPLLGKMLNNTFGWLCLFCNTVWL